MSKWVIYSKNQCPYCDKAKFALKNEPFLEVKNISENPEFFTELMEKNPNARTMPQIYKDDQLIGGYDNLVTFMETVNNQSQLL
jgi:glutaredoxin|tara:strand:+ start:169 stop:420 length:252 start_codon:yes stop_codon:yes gene_type:complete